MQLFRRLQLTAIIISMVVLLTILFSSGCAREEQRVDEPTIKVELANGTRKLKMEEYIAGVVAGEMKSDWPQAAYGAQAIIARTFALKLLEEQGTDQISGKHTEAQAYKSQNITAEIKQAVDQTRGEVITYQGEYIKGWFHSSAGGQTTSAKVGLAYDKPEPEYIISVDSPDQLAPADIKSWQVTLQQSTILAALQQIAGLEAEEITKIKITTRDKSGRADQLQVVTPQETKEVKAAKFRTAVDSDKLKSTLISKIQQQGDKFIFTGGGYGHGVGMSQWGAYALAQDGKSAKEIIKHYFKDIELVKKWD
ncbi:MAG: SpoIID/LytB domain-containing protein [Bacillota bacterium]